MPIFELQTQDGRKFQVDAPDAQTAAASLQDHSGSKVLETVGAFARGGLEGIPIVGPAIRSGAEKLAAGVRSYLDDTPLELEQQRTELMSKAMAREHPVAETAGEITGGIGATAGLGATATGARLLGLAGESLPGMMARGAVSGGAIGGADALVRGESPVTGGGIGLAAGGLGPAAGRAVSTAAAPLARVIRGVADPVTEAGRRVVGAIERDITAGTEGLRGPEFTAARNAGAPVTMMELGGETTRALARSAANTSPEGRAILNRTIDERFEGQGERLTDWLRTTFNYPDAHAQQQALDTVARTVNRPAYAKAYQEGAGGVWHEGLEQISQAPVVQDAIRKAMVTAKNEAAKQGFTPPKNPFEFDASGRLSLKVDENGNRMLPNLQFWDIVKRNLDKTGTREAKDWSRVLRDQLDEVVPSYKTARAGAAHFFGAEDALQAGQDAVASKLGNREMRAGLAKMSDSERQLFQDGFVDRYVQTIREAPDRRSVLNQIATSPAARERLSIALGPQRASELEAMLRVEGIMDLARPAVQGNSTTARQLAELGLAGGVNLYEGGGSFTADPAALTKAMLVYGAARGHRVVDERVAQQVARLLTSNNPADLARGVRSLARNQTMLNSIRQADAALAAIAARGSVPAVSGQFGAQ